MKDNFNKVYLGIISECNGNSKVITEGFGRWLNNSIRSKKSKSRMIWTILCGKDGKGGLFEANGFDGPFPNKDGSAEFWIGKINGSIMKLKMRESIYQDITSDKPNEKKIPITVISVKYKKKKEIILSWSDTEDEMVQKINNALVQFGVRGFSFKSTGMNLKEEEDAKEAAEAEKEAAKHDSSADDDYDDDYYSDSGEEAEEQADEQSEDYSDYSDYSEDEE